jgi:hypothetical protein
MRGAVDRAGLTGPDGVVTIQNIPAGAQRCRITRDGFITLEKEVTIKSAARAAAEAVLSVAPAPPPPPSPSPTPTPNFNRLSRAPARRGRQRPFRFLISRADAR